MKDHTRVVNVIEIVGIDEQTLCPVHSNFSTKQLTLCFLSSQQEVTINYNKLHADPKQGKTLDIGELILLAVLL